MWLTHFDWGLGSFRDFRLVTSGGGLVKFAKLCSTLIGLVMSARRSVASEKFTVNNKPPGSSRTAPLVLKLFSRLTRFSGYVSSVHMLDMARANAWPHLSARTSQEIMGAVPPSAPCSFYGKGVAQTTAHYLASGACSKFQQDKMDRHDEIVLNLCDLSELALRTFILLQQARLSSHRCFSPVRTLNTLSLMYLLRIQSLVKQSCLM